jgi:hypothetical protein
MSAMELALICGTFFAIVVQLFTYTSNHCTANHRNDGSEEEDIYKVDNGVSQFAPEGPPVSDLLFGSVEFESDDVHRLRATECPADNCQNDETDYEAQCLECFGAVVLEVLAELDDNDYEGSQCSESEEHVVPNEEQTGETRYKSLLTCYVHIVLLHITARRRLLYEEEQPRYNDSQTQKGPKGNLRY